MNEERYQTSGSAIYREVGDELVVIQVDTGCFYYFNRTTKQFLDFFRSPSNLDAFVECAGLADGTERGYLENFLGSLKEKRILETPPASLPSENSGAVAGYARPALLREGEKKLDEIASEIAVLTTFI